MKKTNQFFICVYPCVSVAKWVFLLTVLSVVPAFSQVLTSGADFLKIDSGARSGGMGSAFTAVADDVTALTYNPAGLALLQYPEAGYLHMLYLSDIAYNFGGVALPLPSGDDTWGLGAGIINLGTPSFDSTLGLAPPVTAGDNAILLSVAYRVKDIVAFGLTGKYIFRDIAGYTASAFGGDAGVLLTPMERFRVGLGIYNVGQQVKFISVGDPLPTTARLGLAYQVLDIPHHSLLLSVDNGFDLNSSSYIGAGGMEYWFDKTLALRVGYTGDAYQQHMTAGVGVNVDVVEFDYAFSPMGTLGDTHRFSLMVHLDSGEIMGLAAPRGFSAQPMDGAVNLRWSPASSSSVVGYNLYLKKPGAQGLTLVNKKRPINDTSVQLNQLFNGQNYTFALTSVSAAGRESGMAQVSVVPGVAGGAIQGTALPAPTGFRAALNGQGCDLFWDKSASADIVGYNLYLVNPNQAPRKLSNQPVTQTPVNIISLKPGQTYSFYLTAVNKTGNESPASTVLNVSLAGLQNASAPSFKAPAHLKLQKEGQKVHLSWDSAAGAVKYNIYVSHDGTNFKLLTSDGLAKTEALLGPLKAGMPYIFGVSTVSAAGQESDKALLTLPAQ